MYYPLKNENVRKLINRVKYHIPVYVMPYFIKKQWLTLVTLTYLERRRLIPN